MASSGERDLILAPNEYALISDQTKGFIDVYVGPHKTSLANTDQPVVFDHATKRFLATTLDSATTTKVTAPEGWYIVLKNPAERDNLHPKSGKAGAEPLNVGRKVNMPGPVNFALWPGQMAEVHKGHHIRSNQYLVVRVYDDEAARANWKNAIIKPRIENGEDKEEAQAAAARVLEQEVQELTMGKNIVIKGTDVSFYIPPTGVEVVPEKTERGEFMVRNAVTLERLEYSLLLDESGQKRYEQGPKVVFPRPTETFVQKNVAKDDKKKLMTRKFRSIELNSNSGVYVKVICDYIDDAGGEHKVGDELFITGKDQMIYFPREEHAIIKYGTQEIHHAIAIPEGEGRYVMDRDTGQVALIRGPKVFLPDPRNEIIIQRALDVKTCSLMYPGNLDAAVFNGKLLGLNDEQLELEISLCFRGMNAEVKTSGGGISTRKKASSVVTKLADSIGEAAHTAYMSQDSYTSNTVNLRTAAKRFGGDEFLRNTKYTKPRTLVMRNSYEGAVAMDIWTGYAILLVRKSGDRRVVVGPKTVMLEYDEAPQVITLSRGKPKMEKNVLKTVYLRVKNNRISDIVSVETADMCQINLDLSYRMNFTGESLVWFEAENYVKFLSDHMRSIIRNAVKQYSVEEFYKNSANIIRNVVLGEQGEDGKRKGRVFEENGMNVYDVEVLNVQMNDENVESMLKNTQRTVTKNTLSLTIERQNAEHQAEISRLKLAAEKLNAENRKKILKLNEELVSAEQVVELAVLQAKEERQARNVAMEHVTYEAKHANAEVALKTKKADIEIELERQAKIAALAIEKDSAKSRNTIAKAEAVSVDLIAALQAFGDKAMVEKLAESMSPLAILGGKSVVDVVRKLLSGTSVEKYLGADSKKSA